MCIVCSLIICIHNILIYCHVLQSIFLACTIACSPLEVPLKPVDALGLFQYTPILTDISASVPSLAGGILLLKHFSACK